LAEPAARHEEAVGVDATARFLNRELSQLDYYTRVLACAEEDTRTALEQARFLEERQRLIL